LLLYFLIGRISSLFQQLLHCHHTSIKDGLLLSWPPLLPDKRLTSLHNFHEAQEPQFNRRRFQSWNSSSKTHIVHSFHSHHSTAASGIDFFQCLTAQELLNLWKMTQLTPEGSEDEFEGSLITVHPGATAMDRGSDMEVIKNYATFCECGGQPSQAMRQNVRRAMESLKSKQNGPFIGPDLLTQPSMSLSTPRGNDTVVTQAAQFSGVNNPVLNQSIGTSRVDIVAISNLAGTVIDGAVRVVVAWWELKAAKDEVEASRARTELLKAEAAAEKDCETAIRAGERRDQMFVWGTTTAAKFLTDYMMNMK
jgi:hypothetical protein